MDDDFFGLVLIVWAISGVIAGLIATDKERSFWSFALVTFFFLGPIGPGVAMLAQHGAVQRAELLKARGELDAIAARQKAAEATAAKHRAADAERAKREAEGM